MHMATPCCRGPEGGARNSSKEFRSETETKRQEWSGTGVGGEVRYKGIETRFKEPR